MQLHLSSRPEIDKYLESSKAILIPVGSTEQRRTNCLFALKWRARNRDFSSRNRFGRRAGSGLSRALVVKAVAQM